MMAAFPLAHGGIGKVYFEDNQSRMLCFAGGRVSKGLQVISGSDTPLAYAVIDGPAGITVSDAGLITCNLAPDTAAGSTIDFTVEVINAETGIGRQLAGTVEVIAPEVAGSGTITFDGGSVSDENGDFSIQVAPDSVDSDTGIEIVRGVNAEGDSVIQFRADGPIDGMVDITLPDADTFYRQSLKAASQFQPAAASTSLVTIAADDDYPLVHQWGYSTAVLTLNGLYRLPDNTLRSIRWNDFLKMGGLVVTKGSRLMASLAIDAADSMDFTGTEPVLFVHGYKLNNSFGGGEDTWSQFPALIAQLDNSGTTYLPFEFRWRTNARFQDVADDLGRVLKLIYDKTDKKVHIIAHSMGGILTRTLLQGLNADGSEYGLYVASLTTLGTPHAGIADSDQKMHGIYFPQGQDNLSFEGCHQLSCHQLGEYITVDQPPARHRLHSIRHLRRSRRDRGPASRYHPPPPTGLCPHPGGYRSDHRPGLQQHRRRRRCPHHL